MLPCSSMIGNMVRDASDTSVWVCFKHRAALLAQYCTNVIILVSLFLLCLLSNAPMLSFRVSLFLLCLLSSAPMLSFRVSLFLLCLLSIAPMSSFRVFYSLQGVCARKLLASCCLPGQGCRAHWPGPPGHGCVCV